MSSVDLGSMHTIEWKTRPEGVPLTAEVTRPDGTPGTAEVDQARGEATVLADMAGRWLISWSAEQVNYTDIFDVWPADPRFIISIDDAIEGLSASRANSQYIDDLRLYIAAATPVIEDITGPMLLSTNTTQAGGGTASVVLSWATQDVALVEVDGVPVTEWYVEHGILYAGTRQSPGIFPSGTLTATIQTGFRAIPPNVRLAARELVRHWVQIGKQNGGGSSVRQDPADEVFTPSGFAVPRRVVELCAPHEQIGGFA
ncbi:hypothetical protein [Arthrobacter sp. MYb213]|uniref:hypothetical protein n=1 Tax=Arthrobacter sp. MYb213 TaxID=1848595 RepID=UPI000CFCA9B8|nr:hypothetical protein [Arthrobacter sp. MYb213]PRB69515.1 hypothetical protein CQ011_12190 [Arthrobacter sp. MYb213]